MYTGQQVADLWQVDYETILELAQVGELHSVRVGRRRLFPESALEDYLSRHQQPDERASNERTD